MSRVRASPTKPGYFFSDLDQKGRMVFYTKLRLELVLAQACCLTSCVPETSSFETPGMDASGSATCKHNSKVEKCLFSGLVIAI